MIDAQFQLISLGRVLALNSVPQTISGFQREIVSNAFFVSHVFCIYLPFLRTKWSMTCLQFWVLFYDINRCRGSEPSCYLQEILFNSISKSTPQRCYDDCKPDRVLLAVQHPIITRGTRVIQPRITPTAFRSQK